MKRIAVDALAAMGEAAAEVAALPLAKVLRVGPAQTPVPASSDVYLREHAATAIGGMGTDAIKGQQVRLARAIGQQVGASGRGDRDLAVQQAVVEALEGAGLEVARKGSMAFFVDKGPFEEKKEKKMSYSSKAFDDLFGDEIAEDEADEERKRKEQEKKARSKSRSTSRATEKKGRKK